MSTARWRFPARFGFTVLAICLGPRAGATPVRVTASCGHQVLAGGSCRFTARLNLAASSPPAATLDDPRAPREARKDDVPTWTWEILEGGGELDRDTGAYTAPCVDDTRLVRVRATAAGPGQPSGQGSLLVLPHEPFKTIASVLGEDFVDRALLPPGPFLDLATGLRPDAKTQVQEPAAAGSRSARTQVAGLGFPLKLIWKAAPEGAGQMLSYWDGDRVLQRNVTGLTTLDIPLKEAGDALVESLEPLAGDGDRWRSLRQLLPMSPRGMALLAGGDSGDHDGQGASAQFRQPFGVTRMRGWGQGPGGLAVVADAQAHVLRTCNRDGEVATLCGLAGQPGWRDGRGDEARFNGPTFLLEPRGLGDDPGFPRDHCLVADSGNHVLRMVAADGTVRTLAGTGQPGYLDHDDPLQAAFHTPQGLATDFSGNLYVADQGNYVIRRLDAQGRVSTVAGKAGLSGDQDGVGAQARFTRLKGMADWSMFPEAVWLLVLDGHALRRIALRRSEVRTMLGVVAIPSLLDPETQVPVALRSDTLHPCFNDPMGIGVQAGSLAEDLVIADHGNQAVRFVDVTAGVMTTLVGARLQPATRAGFFRDGLPAPLGEAHATLEAPLAISPGFSRWSSLVSTGHGLATLHNPPGPGRPGPIKILCGPAQRLGICTVDFQVPMAAGAVTKPALHYTVDFLNGNGSLADQAQGRGAACAPLRASGRFTQEGEGTVRVTVLTEEGVSAQGQRKVRVAQLEGEGKPAGPAGAVEGP